MALAEAFAHCGGTQRRCGPEDAVVVEEPRAGEQCGQLLDAEQHHW